MKLLSLSSTALLVISTADSVLSAEVRFFLYTLVYTCIILVYLLVHTHTLVTFLSLQYRHSKPIFEAYHHLLIIIHTMNKLLSRML